MSHIRNSKQTARRWKVDTHLDGTDRWEIHGTCSRPVELWYKGAPDPVLVGLQIEKDLPIVGRMSVRCRKCPECLTQRSTLWAARACDEISMSHRTWFGTLTGSPEYHDRALWQARANVRHGGSGDYDTLPEPEQFEERLKVCNPDITLFFKRVRKYSGAKIRYLLVCEQHKTGLPHWHVLLHESTETPVTKALLEAQWSNGFSHWRLVDTTDFAAAFYVSKYLAKDSVARVRASLKYGTPRLADSIVSLVHPMGLENTGDPASPEPPAVRGEVGDFQGSPRAAVKPLSMGPLAQGPKGTRTPKKTEGLV